MLSYFYPPIKEKTRFESVKELQSLLPLLSELYKKSIDLNKAANGDPAHSAYRKSLVVTNVVSQIELLIKEFNKKMLLPAEHAASIKKISKDLHKIIKVALESHYEILNTQQSTKKKFGKDMIKVTTFGSSVGVGVTTGSLFYGASSLLIAAPFLNYNLCNLTGLSDSRTATVKILEKLENKLVCICNALDFSVTNVVFDNPDSILMCPITFERMKNPTLCVLDNRIYEKEAIKRWLEERRTAPFNRKPLGEGQTVNDVLVESISLKEALEEVEKLQIQTENDRKFLEENKEEKKEQFHP